MNPEQTPQQQASTPDVDPNVQSQTDTGNAPKENGDASPQGVAQDPAAGQSADNQPVEYTFSAPDGVELDSGALEEFKALAAEAKLPPELAQKGVDIAVKLMQTWEQKQQEAVEAQVKEWESEAFRRFGNGDKTRFEAELTVAQTAIARFGTNEFKELIATTRIGSHPEFIAFAHAIGKAMAEDTFVSSSRSSSPDFSLKDGLFPKTAKNPSL